MSHRQNAQRQEIPERVATASRPIARDDAAWFAAQLKPNSDAIAARNLARQGFEFFLPRMRRTGRGTERFKAARPLLFPGYVFVSANLVNGHWRAINSTQGITRLVGFNARPAPLPCGFVEALKERCDEDGCVRPIEDLAPGELARVTDGPFSDFVVTIESISHDQRLWVLFDLLGRQTRLALPREALMRA